MTAWLRWLALLMMALPLFAPAQEPSAEQQQRTARLAEQLRCLVCQNQSIADSNADLAVDLRGQIVEQIGQGRSDREILDFMVQRYGDFVLYNPPVKATTLLLWLGPLLLLLLGGGVLWHNLRERRKRAEPLPLSDEERQAAVRLLDGGCEGDRR